MGVRLFSFFTSRICRIFGALPISYIAGFKRREKIDKFISNILENYQIR